MFNQLKKPVLYYFIFGVLFSVIIFLNLTINKYSSSLKDISKRLNRVKANLTSMEAASREINTLITRVNNYIPAYFYKSSTEGKIFSSLDELKEVMNQPEVSASSILSNEVEVSLPLKITGRIDSYSNVVSNAGYLRAMKFPFFGTKNINLVRKQDKEEVSVSYVIVGGLHMPYKKEE